MKHFFLCAVKDILSDVHRRRFDVFIITFGTFKILQRRTKTPANI